MMEDGILGQFLADGIKFNDLIIPGRLVESALSRHVFNLIVNNKYDDFKCYLAGSATAIRYAGREVLLATQHQISDVELSRVGMLTDSGSHIITSGGARGYNSRSDTDAHDIIAFDFTEPCKARPELKRRFFALRDVPPDVPNTHVAAVLLSGCPFSDQVYEIHENNHLGLARRNFVCRPHSQPSDDALLSVQALRPLEINPDGMSGGSAFTILLENEKPKAYFSGLIVRGGNGIFYILKVGYIKAFLDAVFA